MIKNDLLLFFDYLLGENGTDVSIVSNGNTLTRKVIIKELAKRTYWYDKEIISDEALQTGDIIQYNNQTFIISSQIEYNQNLFSAYMKESKFTVKYILSGKLYEFPAYAYGDESLGVDSSSVVSLQNGNVKLCIPAYPANTYRQANGEYLLDVNNRTILDGQPLKSTGVDRTKKGVWIISCQTDSVSTDDDLWNNIPNKSTIHSYSVSITNKPTAALDTGNTLQLTYSCVDNGTAVSSPTGVTFASTSGSVASVDNNGLLTCNAAGTCTISVAWQDATDYFTLQVNAASVVSYKWWYNNDSQGKTYPSFDSDYAHVDILQSNICIFGVDKFVNGSIAETNDTYTWNVDRNGADTNYMTYTNTDTTLTMTNKQPYDSGYIYLYATPSGTGTQLSNYIEIQLKSYF